MKPQKGVQDYDDRDGRGVFKISHEGRKGGGDHEDDHQGFFKLVPEDLPRPSLSFFLKFIGPEFFPADQNFRFRKPGLSRSFKFIQNFVDRFVKPVAHGVLSRIRFTG